VSDILNAIELRDLAKSYGSVHAVRGISLDVRQERLMTVLGAHALV
jgi:ABC-type Fe3+/spermidine/putrescine transport system ATPase subunit